MNDFYQPAEWAPHASVWLAWPSHAELWQENLADTQAEFVALCEAIVDRDPQSGSPRGESLDVLVPTADAKSAAEKALGHLPARFHQVPFGDIWLRDTAPIFVTNGKETAAACFRFNSWGEKYNLPHDSEVSLNVAKKSGLRAFEFPFVLEGGSVEVDGEGTCLTSEQCLLNPNRNPGLSREDLEARLKEALGVSKVLWVRDGLLNDHTDGHIDTIARFSAPGVVLCAEPSGADDPNFEVLNQIAGDLESMTDARGRKLRVVRVPSPGRVRDEDGSIMPASYLNFYIGNSTVVVPTYGSHYDTLAVAAIAKEFPGRRVVGSSAKSILTGGGAFHCISQQQPLEGEG